MTNACSKCNNVLEQNASFCTKCGTSVSGKQAGINSLQYKKDKVLGTRHPEKRSKVRVLIIVGAIVLAGGWFYASLPKKNNPLIEAQPTIVASIQYPGSGQQMFDVPVKVSNGKIIVPLDVVKARKFVAFLYTSPSNSVPLLAYISTGGKLVTAVSMCEPCNSTRFHIQGETLVCNSCGSTWDLNNLAALSGACGKYPPDAIPSIVSGNEIQIDESVVAGWQRRI